MEQYVELVKNVLENGVPKEDRTGTGALSLFGQHCTYDLSEGFPLLWLKKTSFHNIKTELIWFLGNHMKQEPYRRLEQTNIKFLVDNGVNIWNEWPYEKYKNYHLGEGVEDFHTLEEFRDQIKNSTAFANYWGNLGPVYGQQWRDWNGRDQIHRAIDDLIRNPDDRGIIVSAWNVEDLHKMALRPCHSMFQFYTVVNPKGQRELSLHLMQRSGDLFLGIPYNIACYSLLIHMVAHLLDMVPGKFSHMIVDAHIYKNHIDQCHELIERWETLEHKKLPTLKPINPKIAGIDYYTIDDLQIEGYDPYPFIPAPVAV